MARIKTLIPISIPLGGRKKEDLKAGVHTVPAATLNHWFVSGLIAGGLIEVLPEAATPVVSNEFKEPPAGLKMAIIKPAGALEPEVIEEAVTETVEVVPEQSNVEEEKPVEAVKKVRIVRRKKEA
jgi:hypothetical protein